MAINWEVVKPSLWTGVGGVVVGMFLLSYGFDRPLSLTPW